MNKAKVLDKTGKLTVEKELTEIFNEKEVNKELMLLAIRAYLANNRIASANTKTRSEVAGSTRKLFRQKGTGNARQGSIRSPLHRGGGIAFGPRSNANYKIKLNKKMRKAALRSALTQKANDNKVFLIDGENLFEKITASSASKFLKNSKMKGSMLLVTQKSNNTIMMSFGNLKLARVLPVNELNVYEILNCENIAFTADALKLANEFWKK